MKWFDLAKMLVPVVGAVVPGAAPLVPFILTGIHEAEALHGDDGQAKKAHVLTLVANGAAAVSATGKVSIDPGLAVAVTNAVFQAVDNVHDVVKANQPASTGT
jgi:hypothetical protein